MRKKVFGKNFSRSGKARLSMYRSLVRALVLNGRISTTIEKAKVLKVYVEKLITTAKKETVSSRRRLYADLGNAREVSDEIVRLSGILQNIKIIPLPARKGDMAKMARIEIVGWAAKEKKEEEKNGKKGVTGSKKAKEKKSEKADKDKKTEKSEEKKKE